MTGGTVSVTVEYGCSGVQPVVIPHLNVLVLLTGGLTFPPLLLLRRSLTHSLPAQWSDADCFRASWHDCLEMRQRTCFRKWSYLIKNKLNVRFEFCRLFPKIAKSNIFIMSVRPLGTAVLPLDGFWWNSIFELFAKIWWENSSSIKVRQENGYFTWRRFHIYDRISLNSS